MEVIFLRNPAARRNRDEKYLLCSLRDLCLSHFQILIITNDLDSVLKRADRPGENLEEV
jgi:hypothetical protein